jgi:hypothetical protein
MTRRQRAIAEALGGLTDDEFVRLRLELGDMLERIAPAELWEIGFSAMIDHCGGAEKVLALAIERLRR